MPSQTNESQEVIVTVLDELLLIVKSKVTVLSHPLRSEYKLVYNPVDV